MVQKGYNDAVSGNVNSTADKFSYLGQEEQTELGLNWLNFRYRNYMPEIGRFFGVDPISADYVSISTYQVAHNNPIWKIEIEGLEGETFNGEPDPQSYEPAPNPSRGLQLPTEAAYATAGSGNNYGGSGGNSKSPIKHSGSVSLFQKNKNDGHVAKADIEASYGPITVNGSTRILGGSFYNTTGEGELPLAVSLGAEGSIADAQIVTTIGNERYSIFGGGNGSVGKVKANFDLGVFTGEGGDVGTKAKYDLGAYTAKGDLFVGANLPYFKAKFTAGGSVLSVHSGSGFNTSFNEETGVFTLSGFQYFGDGQLGEKTAAKIEFNFVQFADDIYKAFFR